MLLLNQHRVATAMANDTAWYQQRGADTAALLMVRAYRDVVRAYTRGQDVSHPFREQLMNLVPVVRDAMVIAYLLGVDRVYQAIAPRVELALKTVFRESVDWHRRRLKMSVKDLRQLSKQLEATALQVLSTTSVFNERALQRTMLRIQKEGMHVREGKRELAKTFDSLGLVPKSSHQLETIFRTQTQIAYSAGQARVEEDPDIAELIWGYEYVTVDDDRVRPEHAGLDGVILPKDDPFWTRNSPPNGWNCRCQRIPVLDPPEEEVKPPAVFEGVRPGADEGFRVSPKAMADFGFPQPPLPPLPRLPAMLPKSLKPRINTAAKKAQPKRSIAEIHREHRKVLKEELSGALGGRTKVDFSYRVSDEKAIEVLETIGNETKRLRNVYPNIKGMINENPEWLKGIDFDASLPKGAAGWHWSQIKSMGVNVSNKGVESAVPFARNTFSVSEQSYRGTFRHEMGHAVQKPLNAQSTAGVLPAAEMEWAWDDIFQEGVDHSKFYWKANVTEYAATNAAELYAESFAAYTHPKYGLLGTTRLPAKVEAYLERHLGAKNPNLLGSNVAKRVTAIDAEYHSDVLTKYRVRLEASNAD